MSPGPMILVGLFVFFGGLVIRRIAARKKPKFDDSYEYGLVDNFQAVDE